jgi:selenocysteine lyase/cysteine desulfurase
MALDVMLARAQFPALSGEWIFMDNAGGSQVPIQVADAVRDYLLQTNVQLGASYQVSRNAQEAVWASRQLVADWIGAVPDEIVFGQNSSQLLRTLALMLSSAWEADDEVIISQGEHEANAGCWEHLEQFGIVVKTWEIDPNTFAFDLGKLSEMITEKTKLIAVHHSSNILGNVLPLKDIVKIARGAGAYVCVDGVGYVPHRLVDVADLGVDFYVFSPYKAFGPHMGVLYGRSDLLKKIPKWTHFFFADDQVPEKIELGSTGYESAAGLVRLEKYFRAVGKNVAGPVRELIADVYDDILGSGQAEDRDAMGALLRRTSPGCAGPPPVQGSHAGKPCPLQLRGGVGAAQGRPRSAVVLAGLLPGKTCSPSGKAVCCEERWLAGR